VDEGKTKQTTQKTEKRKKKNARESDSTAGGEEDHRQSTGSKLPSTEHSRTVGGPLQVRLCCFHFSHTLSFFFVIHFDEN
jgi:hypothetical protein